MVPIKYTVILFLILLLLTCMYPPTQQDNLFNCEAPEGIEYTCYSDEECTEFFKGYSAIIKHRFHNPKWYAHDTQTVHINIFADHLSMYLIGKITAIRLPNKKIHQKVQTETYDLECNLIEEGQLEGYRK